MTRTLYDSTTPWDIPRDAEMIGYYVDGRYAWSQAWLDLFPNAVKVSISAIGARSAHVGDVEVGCIWPPANAVPWVVQARRDGYDPTVYCNELNDWLAVRQAFWNAGVPEPHYWVARYNGVPEVPTGAVARQYAHPGDADGIVEGPWETGLHYDKSAVRDFWPGVDQYGPGGGGGAGEEDPMAGFTEGQIKNLVYGAMTDWWNDLSNGMDKTTYDNFGRVMKDHVVSPVARQVGDVDEEAIAVKVTPALVAAISQLDTSGLNEAETVAAVQEALRQGTGPA